MLNAKKAREQSELFASELPEYKPNIFDRHQLKRVEKWINREIAQGKQSLSIEGQLRPFVIAMLEENGYSVRMGGAAGFTITLISW